MEMPPWIVQYLVQYRDIIWTFLLVSFGGWGGSYIAVFLEEEDRGRPLTPQERRSTFFIGTILALTFAGSLGQFIQVPFDKSVPIAGTALVIAVLGKPIARMIRKIPVRFPGQKGEQA